MKRRLGKYNSWGNLKPDITDVYVLPSDNPDLSAIKNKWLPHGLGRSYGDSCLLTDGDMVLSDDLRRFRSFDAENGILCVEAGVSLGEIW
jgi:FAD/FMN-containing dehydrogenase